MNELIKICQNDDRITVLARDLYEFLEVGTLFKDWFPRMLDYGFSEPADYNPLKNEQVRLEGNREVKRELVDYQMTIEMAKEIAMLQRNEKGKMARQYFIELEKRWNSPEKIMARALIMSQKELANVRVENLAMKPKAEYFDQLVDRNLLTNFRDTAKELHIGQKKLISFMEEYGYLYRTTSKELKPYINYVTDGLFELKEFVSKNNYVGIQTFITPKGRETLRMLLKMQKCTNC